MERSKIVKGGADYDAAEKGGSAPVNYDMILAIIIVIAIVAIGLLNAWKAPEYWAVTNFSIDTDAVTDGVQATFVSRFLMTHEFTVSLAYAVLFIMFFGYVTVKGNSQKLLDDNKIQSITCLLAIVLFLVGQGFGTYTTFLNIHFYVLAVAYVVALISMAVGIYRSHNMYVRIAMAVGCIGAVIGAGVTAYNGWRVTTGAAATALATDVLAGTIWYTP